MVENVPGGVFLLDENLNYLLTNHLYREIFGIPDGLADAGKPIEGVIRHLAPRSTYGEGELDEIVEQRLAQIREEHPAPVEVTVADQLYLMTYGRMPGGERVGIVVDITERKRAEEALREQSGIVELLHKTAASSNQAEDVTEALQSCIDAICAYKSWPIGHVYMLSESVPDTLVPTSIWHLDEPDRFTNFRDVTEQTEFKIGVGIPGRVLESGRPVWIADITKATNVPRAELAVDIGVKAGFGVPVLIGSDVVAVMEFFAPDAVEADENLISVLNNIGTQVGRMVERKSAENELAEAHELITSSIDYASNIQRSALPSDEMLSEALGEHFVIWEPRDVVGGDIYWVRRVEGGHIVVVADCTGHGVPGAFLTMIATGALRQAIIEHPDGDPAMVIARMNTFIKNSLRQGIDKGPADDGLELGICCIDADGERLTFAGARFSLWKLNSQGTEEIKGDKSGIGYRHVPPDQAFTNHEVTLAPGSTYYMFSDGLVDQVGGDKRRAFGKKRIIALLEDHLTRPLTEQRDAIMDAFATYQGDEIRRDDVTFLGFRMQS